MDRLLRLHVFLLAVRSSPSIIVFFHFPIREPWRQPRSPSHRRPRKGLRAPRHLQCQRHWRWRRRWQITVLLPTKRRGLGLRCHIRRFDPLLGRRRFCILGFTRGLREARTLLLLRAFVVRLLDLRILPTSGFFLAASGPSRIHCSGFYHADASFLHSRCPASSSPSWASPEL